MSLIFVWENSFNITIVKQLIDRLHKVRYWQIDFNKSHIYRDVRFGFKVVQIDLKWDKSGTFSRSDFSDSQRVLKYFLEKSRIVSFWANLTHFGPTCDIPVTRYWEIRQRKFQTCSRVSDFGQN